MFSDTAFGHLVWKEYRTHRPLWLALLIGTPVLQIGILAMIWINDGLRLHSGISEGTANALMATGFIASVVYLLGCCATMFSVEHETGVFDFQRVLPATQPRVFWAKVAFAFVSSLALTVVLWIVTRGMFLWSVPKTSGWFGSFGLLYMAEVFAWGIFASLLIRQPLWGVIAAIALQSLTMQVVLPYLTIGPNDLFNLLTEDRRFIASRFVVLVVLFVADVVLGRLWFEDRLRLPRWRLRWKPEFAPSYPVDAELPPYLGLRQLGWRRLLWLSWRDARWVTAAVLAWYGYVYWTMRNPNQWEGLMLISLIGSFVIGLFAFAPEQWGGRFRFLTERGCTPRVAWLCRQALWLPPVLLMCLATNRMRMQLDAIHPHPMGQRVVEEMLAAMMPLVCYAAGQFAAMLFRSTVMAIAVGIGLCFVGGMWSGLMTNLLAPTWWAVGSLPVIGLFVTWLKANDWIEERRDRVARWRTVLGLGVPISLLLAATVTYRIVQIPVVTLPANWDSDTTTVLAKLTPAEKETVAIYRRALSEFEQNENRHQNYEDWFRRVREEHPDWTEREIRTETFESSNRDWWQRHVTIVPLLREAHHMAPVPLALAEVDEGGQSSRYDPFSAEPLSWLMAWQAKQSLREGKLDQTWEDILIAFELGHRYSLRSALTKQVGMFSYGTLHESQLLEILAEWSRHPEQTREHIVAAIRKLEEFIASPDEGRREVHHRFLEAQSLFDEEARWKELHSTTARTSTSGREQSWGEEAAVYWKLWKFFPWERWRSTRAARFLTVQSLTEIDQLQTLLKWNVPERYSVAPPLRTAALERAAALAPADVQATLSALSQANPDSAEQVMSRTTLLPSSLRLGFPTFAESNFWDRATSYRVTMLLLALADFRREQGRYPESLNELAPSYFAEVPRDPKTAGPFVYFPHGVPEDVTTSPEDDPQFHVIVRKSIPFLMAWSDRGSPSYRIDSRQKPSGDWEFIDTEGKTLELPTALRRGIRIWALPLP